jgi:hypothetical protein
VDRSKGSVLKVQSGFGVLVACSRVQVSINLLMQCLAERMLASVMWSNIDEATACVGAYCVIINAGCGS